MAQKAKEKTEKAQENTEKELQNLMNELSNAIGSDNAESGGGDKPTEPEDEYNKAEVDKKVDKPSTIDGKEPNENNPYIPKGFKPINTDTSKWDDPSGPQVNKGLVISDRNSEFVFIPVSNINDMVMCQTHGASQTIDQETLQCPECKETTKLAGRLYATITGENFNANLKGQTYTKNDSGLREPDNLIYNSDGNDYSDNTARLKNETWTENLYQDDFNNMVKSVAKNKGFYVGRYETSLNGAVAQSKAGQNPMSWINWWKLYENSKTYSKSNSSLGVTSEMIWGCQWDTMMKFILTTEDSSHVTAKTNVGHTMSEFTSYPYQTGGANYDDVYIGSVKYNDITTNIYDLEGNCSEWVQEAHSTSNRVCRGGNYGNNLSPSARFAIFPTTAHPNSSRLTIY